MGTEHWGMEVIEGPLVTLEEAKRRVEVEKVCLRAWRESSERKARELEESAKRRETLEAELRTLRPVFIASQAFIDSTEDDDARFEELVKAVQAVEEKNADAR